MHLSANNSALSYPSHVLLLSLATLALAHSLYARQPTGASTAQTKAAADVSRRMPSAPIIALADAGNASGIQYPPWDIFSDTWVATDALDRGLPSSSDAGLPRQHRSVGAFYFLWLYPREGFGPFDITQILARDPQAATNASSPPRVSRVR